MDEVTFVKTKFRQEQWEKLITDCQSSGLKVDDWCEKNQISRHAYYYWLRKIRKKACNSILPTIPKQNTSQRRRKRTRRGDCKWVLDALS